uniref:Uncharacterized protein n=1 Tax=Heliothis virescens TaxID=7102 RepID=A0A2A4JDB0_HELVI
MHALSKKLYYDVMKSGQEDTILESDVMDEECEYAESPKSTSDVGCFARTHTKSYAVQTQWSRSDKNFRNECTTTNDEESSIASRDIAVHLTANCADLAINRVRSVQTSPVSCQKILPEAVHTSAEDAQKISAESAQCSYPESAQRVLTDKNTLIGQKVVEVRGFQLEKKGFAQASRSVPGRVHRIRDTKWTKTEQSQYRECTTNTACITKEEKGHDACNCDQEYYTIPCNRGLTACRNFTLGTAEFRRGQNEQCNTKLIAGCRVPVAKNQKCRL